MRQQRECVCVCLCVCVCVCVLYVCSFYHMYVYVFALSCSPRRAIDEGHMRDVMSSLMYDDVMMMSCLLW